MKTVAIRYEGSSGVRIVKPYRWDASNDHVVDVDVDTAANLLTLPGDDFVIATMPDDDVVDQLEQLIGATIAPLEE
jgi:hypothetical protein